MQRLEVFKKQFSYYKSLAEKSIDQLEEKELFEELVTGTNSVAIVMKHIAGNMLSRWTNIFEEDGEKDWRNRDEEFVDRFEHKKELMAYWDKGWKTLFQTLEALDEEDLDSIIYIRNMGTTVHDAIIRQICHYPYHIGQIVHMAKQFRGENFKSLSIPKGESASYNQLRFQNEKTIKHFTDDIK